MPNWHPVHLSIMPSFTPCQPDTMPKWPPKTLKYPPWPSYQRLIKTQKVSISLVVAACGDMFFDPPWSCFVRPKKQRFFRLFSTFFDFFRLFSTFRKRSLLVVTFFGVLEKGPPKVGVFLRVPSTFQGSSKKVLQGPQLFWHLGDLPRWPFQDISTRYLQGCKVLQDPSRLPKNLTDFSATTFATTILFDVCF